MELIKFYTTLLEDKTSKISDIIERLANGLNIMNSTTEKVAQLQKLLEVKMVEVEIEKTATGKLIAEVEIQSADA